MFTQEFIQCLHRCMFNMRCYHIYNNVNCKCKVAKHLQIFIWDDLFAFVKFTITSKVPIFLYDGQSSTSWPMSQFQTVSSTFEIQVELQPNLIVSLFDDVLNCWLLYVLNQVHVIKLCGTTTAVGFKDDPWLICCFFLLFHYSLEFPEKFTLHSNFTNQTTDDNKRKSTVTFHSKEEI